VEREELKKLIREKKKELV